MGAPGVGFKMPAPVDNSAVDLLNRAVTGDPETMRWSNLAPQDNANPGTFGRMQPMNTTPNFSFGNNPMQMDPGYFNPGLQMPQPSANNGGRYRLSPGVYGTREQAMRQYENSMSPVNAMPMVNK
jgi:hypothetical protein